VNRDKPLKGSAKLLAGESYLNIYQLVLSYRAESTVVYNYISMQQGCIQHQQPPRQIQTHVTAELDESARKDQCGLCLETLGDHTVFEVLDCGDVLHRDCLFSHVRHCLGNR